MTSRRRSPSTGGNGCAIALGLVFVGLPIYLIGQVFRASSVLGAILIVVLIGVPITIAIVRSGQRRAADAYAKAEAARQIEGKRLAALRQVQQDREDKKQDTRDRVRVILNQWRITPEWLIEGRAKDAKRYSLAGLEAVYKDGFLVITGPGVAVSEKADRTASGKPLTVLAAEITRLAEAAEAAGPPILSRSFEGVCRCPAGHKGLHSIAIADNHLVLRTCVQDGCGQTWQE